jgi:hypothetical protein
MRKISLFFICTIFYLSTTAQTGHFIMSSVGVLPGTESNGVAIQFSSITKCIDVQSGLAVLSVPRGNGQFAINCEVTMKINSLGVKLFPNPVNHLAKIKLNNTPPLTETFSLSIWTSEGALIKSQKETGYNLFQGLNIDLSGLVNGTYILKIESPTYMDAIKFIKAN